MPKAKGGWYAVAVGRNIGVFETWDQCLEQIKGFSNARYKKFTTKVLAEEFVRANSHIIPKPTTPKKHPTPAYYGVARGHCPGVYYTWTDCQHQITSFKGPVFKKFKTEVEAIEFCALKGDGVRPMQLPNLNETSNAINDLSNLADTFSPQKPGNSSVNDEDGILSQISDLIKPPTTVTPCSFIKGNPHFAERKVVYTDGSCINQDSLSGQGPRRAGIGVYWGPGSPLNLSERLWGQPTNQRAELWAAIRALQTGVSAGYTKLEVRTDSSYTIKGITEWIVKWRENGYRTSNGDVKNRELFRCLDSLTKLIDVKWVHVKAHCGVQGNEQADQLAKSGADKEVMPDNQFLAPSFTTAEQYQHAQAIYQGASSGSPSQTHGTAPQQQQQRQQSHPNQGLSNLMTVQQLYRGGA